MCVCVCVCVCVSFVCGTYSYTETVCMYVVCLMCAWTCEVLHYYSDLSIYVGHYVLFCNSVLHNLTLHMT